MKMSAGKTILFTITVGAALWAGTWKLADTIAGDRPTVAYQKPKPAAPFLKKLNTLAQKIEVNPESVELWRSYAAELETAVRHSSDQELIAELQHAYSNIIKLEPEGALTERERLADVRFTLKDFAKASLLYRSILDIQPENQKVRGRLASALTFLGQFDAAIEQLQAIISADPESFQGHAYLAITYAQMNKVDRALETGKKALALAPNEEARQRFQSFLASLSGGAAEPAAPTRTAIEEYLTTNPITRNKFMRSEVSGEALLLYMKDFPVAAMPPVAKEKFFGTLKAKATELPVKRIQILDASSNGVLAEIPLQATE